MKTETAVPGAAGPDKAGPDKAGPGKADGAYRTIGEVAEVVGEPAHVIRFWETRIPQIRPALRAKGRRRYRPEEARLIEAVAKLVRERGVTLDGVRRILAVDGRPGVFAAAGMGVRSTPNTTAPADPHPLRAVVAELERARAALREAIQGCDS